MRAATRLVIGHAQIGGSQPEEFVRNNVQATERLLEAALRRLQVPYVVSISSSVVNSMAVDDYTETKKAQEALVAASGIKQIVLRPTSCSAGSTESTLAGSLDSCSRSRSSPSPARDDFCGSPSSQATSATVIAAAIDQEMTGAYNITGQERIDYIDLIRASKSRPARRPASRPSPTTLFWTLLKVNALFDRNPAFTVGQLKALVTPDVFEVIDWPAIFGIRATRYRRPSTRPSATRFIPISL